MNLKKLEKYLRVNLLGPGPRLMKHEFTVPRFHEVEKHRSRQWNVPRSTPDLNSTMMMFRVHPQSLQTKTYYVVSTNNSCLLRNCICKFV